MTPLPPSTSWTLLITGTLTSPPTAPDTPPTRWVYQRVQPGHGNQPNRRKRDLQRRRHVIPKDPRNPIQQALRARIADATHAWQSATDDTRNTYRALARSTRISGFMQWVSDWCAAHPIDYAAIVWPGTTVRPLNPLRIAAAPLDLAYPPQPPTTLNLA